MKKLFIFLIFTMTGTAFSMHALKNQLRFATRSLFNPATRLKTMQALGAATIAGGAATIATPQKPQFTIINQTNNERELEIVESRRPSPGAYPKAITNKPHTVIISGKSIKAIDLKECPLILLHRIERKKVIDEVKKIERTSTSTATTCHEPYPYDHGENASLFDNSWGLVIHEPITHPQKTNGYSFSFLHPKILAQTTVDTLPIQELY